VQAAPKPKEPKAMTEPKAAPKAAEAAAVEPEA